MSKCKKEICVEINFEDLDFDELQDRDYFVYENPCKDGELCFESLNEDWREMLTSKLGVPFMTDTEEIINLIRCKLL